jgi:hypothetical protein
MWQYDRKVRRRRAAETARARCHQSMRERIDRCGDPAMERVMLIILCLYAVALWAIFSRFKLARWGWASGSVAVLVGVLILVTFLALFNHSRHLEG